MRNLIIYRENSPNVTKKIKYYKDLGVNAVIVDVLDQVNDEKIEYIKSLNDRLTEVGLKLIIDIDIMNLTSILLSNKVIFDWSDPKIRNAIYQFINYLQRLGVTGFYIRGFDQLLEKYLNVPDFLAYMREFNKNIRKSPKTLTIAEFSKLDTSLMRSLSSKDHKIFDYLKIDFSKANDLIDVKAYLGQLYNIEKQVNLVLSSDNGLKGLTNYKNYPFKSHSLIAGLSYSLAGAVMISDFEELGIYDFDATRSDVNLIDKSKMTFEFYKQIFESMEDFDVFSKGSFRILFSKDKDILSFMRVYEDQKLIIFANFSQSEILADIRFHFIDLYDYKYLIGNYGRRSIVKNLLLRPYEYIAFIKNGTRDY